ncbi:hypothetical protein F5141DRAFT_108655 [Pisolithus sp. B1]|nr:hypothetical protein F5141DRAFT_108655 [Pisolithus sp. B1]
MEAGASVGSATILRSPDRDDGPSPTIPKTDTSGGPAHGEGPRGRMPRTLSCEPPLRKPISLSVLPIWLASLISMLARLDHPGFIWRTLEATQQDTAKPNGDRETNVKQRAVFSDTFQRDIENINLLATVLLTANFSFLAIQSIDQNGLSYWSQRLSYTSLLSAMASVVMGLAIRTPRFFTAHSSFYFQTMVVVLGFPFELFLCSVFFFIAALVVHFNIHTAKFQSSAAILIFSLVFVCLSFYWLMTEPRDGELVCWKAAASRDEAAAAN